ncbi:MAG TPA: GNAT family N-acetyltransferase [Gaiellaceae bacterium]|jgi:hypothetical protein
MDSETMTRSRAPSRGGLEVTVARTREAAEELRPVWERHRWPRVDADIDYFLAVTDTQEGDSRPYVVALSGDAEGMFVGRLEDAHLWAGIGYRTLYRPRVRSLVLAHGGLAGTENPAVCDALCDQLFGSLRAGEADVLILPALPMDSPFARAVKARLSSFDRRTAVGAEATHRRQVLPESVEAFLESKAPKTRYGWTRPGKKLTKEFGDRLSLVKYREPGDVERIFADQVVVAEKTYQQGLGVAFGDTERQHRLVELALDRGWYRSYVLYLDGKPIAFWPGIAYERVFFVGTPGYDPELARYSLGAYLQLEIVADLCLDPDVDIVDFGFGDAEYKRRLGTESWTEQEILVFAPTLRARRIQLVRGGILGAASLAKRLLGEGRVAALKKRWRERLSRKG